jgi:hypothetical protein
VDTGLGLGPGWPHCQAVEPDPDPHHCPCPSSCPWPTFDPRSLHPELPCCPCSPMLHELHPALVCGCWPPTVTDTAWGASVAAAGPREQRVAGSCYPHPPPLFRTPTRPRRSLFVQPALPAYFIDMPSSTSHRFHPRRTTPIFALLP